ncbi:MAG: glycosyltransferase N-terminal domain-containing protein [Bacteroidota bacterium]
MTERPRNTERMYFSENNGLVYFIYNLLTVLVWPFLKIIGLFNVKIRLFVTGRQQVFQILETQIDLNDKVIWMHAASLGEYEQGLPILEQLKKEFPAFKILLTFFSPSGFEVKKNSAPADVITYLPLDSRANAERFVELVHPALAIFIKYEVWPNHLRALQKRGIPSLLVSALFLKRQIYFKWYGGFMRNSLQAFHHFFVQDKNAMDLLQSIHITNVTVSGDTRFDRVSEILKKNNHLDFMEAFKQDKICIVAGSTWPEDEKILVPYLNSAPKSSRFVIAPHTMKPSHMEKLIRAIPKPVIKYSELGTTTLDGMEILIIDTIGMLTKIYSYADVAYVGGGFATGLHNTLEPAVYGIPVVIGPKYEGFKEAEELVARRGILPISDTTTFSNTMSRLLNDPSLRAKMGEINTRYIQKNQGATQGVMEHVRTIL